MQEQEQIASVQQHQVTLEIAAEIQENNPERLLNRTAVVTSPSCQSSH